MTPLEQRILQARNHQLVARIMRDRAMEAAATKLMDVALDHWARQAALRHPFNASAN